MNSVIAALLTGSVLCEANELVCALSLIVVGLCRARGITQFVARHLRQVFLRQQPLLDQRGFAQSLAHVHDFIVPWSVDLEAKFAAFDEVPVPNLHVVSACYRVLGCLLVECDARVVSSWHEDRATNVRTLARVVKQFEPLPR